MQINLEDAKNKYFETLVSEDLKGHHKSLESQLSSLNLEELESRLEDSLRVLRILSEDKAHYDGSTNIKDDINFFKANGLMYLSEYHKRFKDEDPSLKKRRSAHYIVQTYSKLVLNCGPLDSEEICSDLPSVEIFALRSGGYLPDGSISSLPMRRVRKLRALTQN